MTDDAKVRAVVWEGKGEQPWRSHLIARNNEVIYQSEGYVQKQSAIDTAALVVGPENVEVLDHAPKTASKAWDGEERLYAE